MEFVNIVQMFQVLQLPPQMIVLKSVEMAY
jgi:hypothetical protein